jgi:hypothetical protein
MAQVSELMIAHPEFQSFRQLEAAVIEVAKRGEIFLEFDVKPEYPDTPRDWEWQLESVFYRAGKVRVEPR